MNNVISRFLMLSMLLGLPAAYAVDDTTPNPYAQAVANYVTAAGRELDAIRGEIDVGAKQGDESRKQKYAAVYAELNRSAKSLEALKAAEPKDFDRLKADYERTRGEMVVKLDQARRGN